MATTVSKNINIGLPPKPKSSNNTLFSVVLLLVVCGLFGFFIILPKKSAVAAKQSQLQQLKSQEALITTQAAQLNGLIASLQNHSQDVKELDASLPLNGKTFDLQLLLESLANESGVTVGSINLSGNGNEVLAGDTSLLEDPYSASRTLQTITGEVYVIGSFPQLLGFLQKIENSDRIMQVTSLEISSDDNNGSSLSLKIDLNAYYFAS